MGAPSGPQAKLFQHSLVNTGNSIMQSHGGQLPSTAEMQQLSLMQHQ